MSLKMVGVFDGLRLLQVRVVWHWGFCKELGLDTRIRKFGAETHSHAYIFS